NGNLPSRASMASIGPLAFTNRARFFGDIDSDRTPGDAPSASHTSRRAELIEPRSQFVCHPLPVTRSCGRPDNTTMNVGEVRGKARIPAPPSFRVIAREIGNLLDSRAKTCRTHQRAVRAGQASGSDIVPAGILVIPVQHFFDAGIVHASAHV